MVELKRRYLKRLKGKRVFVRMFDVVYPSTDTVSLPLPKKPNTHSQEHHKKIRQCLITLFLASPLLQGDVEKSLGWKPIPLFDRDHAEEVASMQVCKVYLLCAFAIKMIRFQHIDYPQRHCKRVEQPRDYIRDIDKGI